MNAALDGYEVTLSRADFSPWGLSVELGSLTVRQDAHPEPPVLVFPRLLFDVQWLALLDARLVADASIDRPRLHLDLPHLNAELEDDTEVEDKGWQDAFEQAYPLQVNEIRIDDGLVTWIGESGPPLQLSGLDATLANIRNVDDPSRVHPSDVRADAVLQGVGRASFDGRADFLRRPHPAVTGSLRVDDLPLGDLGQLAEEISLRLTGGRLSGEGRLHWGPEEGRLDVGWVQVDLLQLDYLHTSEAPEDVAEFGTEDSPSEDPFLFTIDRLEASDSNLGFVDRVRDPAYRLFLSDVEGSLEGWSNAGGEAELRIELDARFMSSGPTAIRGRFSPDDEGADFALAVGVRRTELSRLNDFLSAWGDLDVAEGGFLLFSELEVSDGRVDGYVKPMFRDVEVYDESQDEDDPLPRRLWEGIAGGLAEVLENPPRDEVATVADLSGRIEDPEASNLQVLSNLARNAWIEAIRPGFREQTE